VNGVPISLWLYWAIAVSVVAGTALALATGWLKLSSLLTAREWKIAAQVLGIALLALVIIYFQNAHRYDAKDFIYGRF
jgi:hypothetical protein